MAMEIWNHECRPISPNFAVFAIVCHIGTAISCWIGLLGWRPLGWVFVFVPLAHPELFMIPPLAPHAAFCPIRVVIPSVNSKQPVRQRAKSQGMGPRGISRVVNRGSGRQNRQGFLPWMVARDGRFCHFGSRGYSVDCHHAKWHGDLWGLTAWESPLDSRWIGYGGADPICRPAWRYAIRDTFSFGSF